MAAVSSEAILKQLPVGQRITLVPESAGQVMPEGQEIPEVVQGYPSRIEDVVGDSVVVSMPMRRRSLVVLPVKSGVSAFFNRGGFRYYFRAIVTAQKEVPFPVLYLGDIADVRKEERRSHVRVDALIEPLRIKVVEGGDREPCDLRSTLVVNISAGGLGLVSWQPLPLGLKVRIALELPRGYGRLEADTEVVRSTVLEVSGVQKWRIGLAFRSMQERERDRVISFIVYQQQLLRRRGLL